MRINKRNQLVTEYDVFNIITFYEELIASFMKPAQGDEHGYYALVSLILTTSTLFLDFITMRHEKYMNEAMFHM
jgi:hypothetical protein